jgi:hypothetical protein
MSNHTTAEEHWVLVKEAEELVEMDPPMPREERVRRTRDFVRRHHGYPSEWRQVVGDVEREAVFTPEFKEELARLEKEAREKQNRILRNLVDPQMPLLANDEYHLGLALETYPLPDEAFQLLMNGWCAILSLNQEAHFARLCRIGTLLARYCWQEGKSFMLGELERSNTPIGYRAAIVGFTNLRPTEFSDISSSEFEIARRVYIQIAKLGAYSPTPEVRTAALQQVAQYVQVVKTAIRDRKERTESDIRFYTARRSPGEAETARLSGEHFVTLFQAILDELNSCIAASQSGILAIQDWRKRSKALARLDLDAADQRRVFLDVLANEENREVLGLTFFFMIGGADTKRIWEHADLRDAVYAEAETCLKDKEAYKADTSLLKQILAEFADKCNDSRAATLYEQLTGKKP